MCVCAWRGGGYVRIVFVTIIFIVFILVLFCLFIYCVEFYLFFVVASYFVFDLCNVQFFICINLLFFLHCLPVCKDKKSKNK